MKKAAIRIRAVQMHNMYEQYSMEEGWDTQTKCKVAFKDLPITNQKVMLRMAEYHLKYEKQILEGQANEYKLVEQSLVEYVKAFRALRDKK